MSFGWSVGDIVFAVNVLVKVGKALKESGGAATEYQEAVKFLESVSKTLSGIAALLQEHPNLKWEPDVVEQGNNLKSAVEEFEKKISKFDLSLGVNSTRSKARAIPRKVQFALNFEVDKLRVAVAQAQLVMDVVLNLQTLTSILDMSRNSSMSLNNIERLTEMVSESLPRLSEGIGRLDKDIKSTAREAKASQQVLELQILTYLNTIEEYMLDMKKIQETARGKTIDDRGSQICWQMDLRRSIQYLQSFSAAQLELLLQIALMKEERTPSTSSSSLQVTMIAIQVISSGLASGLGAIVAFSVQNYSSGAQSTLGQLLDSHLLSQQTLSDASPPDSPLLQTYNDVWETARMQAARTFEEHDEMSSYSDTSKLSILSTMASLL